MTSDLPYYAELHAHSCFSLLDGVPFPHELADRALELGQRAMALTDHDAIYGMAPFCQRASEIGLKAIIGAEITLEDQSHLTLLAENDDGYANLCRLITAGRLNAPKGESRLPWQTLVNHTAGLICLTGCRQGPVARPAAAGDMPAARRALAVLTEIFGHRNVFVEVQRNLRRDDVRISRRLIALANERRLPYVATGNVHYLTSDDADLQSALVCIRNRVPLPKAGGLLRPNHEYYLRSPREVLELFRDFPQAVANTRLVAERCNAQLPHGLQVLPQAPTPSGMSADEYLRFLCEKRLPDHYPRSLQQAAALLEKELLLIRQLGLANYFLVVAEIITYCEQNQILVHGRGSAANSLVAKLLGISAADPIGQQLVVERFISTERGGTPDIDLDIEAGDKREQVIQFVFERWNRECSAMACTYSTYRSRSAIRDAGFALGFRKRTIAEIVGDVESERRIQELDEDGQVEHEDTPIDQLAPRSGRLSSAQWQQLVSLASRLHHRPRHLGLHNGGMVVVGHPIDILMPVEPAAMAGRRVVQFDKEWLEALGIVKIDLLGLRMLAAIADTLAFIRARYGRQINLHKLDFRDRAVYDLICSTRTIGIFQVESGAQVSLIPHLQPRSFSDLTIQVSLIRPGPLQARMVGPFLRRRKGLEPVTYPHPLMRPALENTLGVIVFQEEVIRLAVDVAGFSPGRGELLRRALGNKNAAEAIEQFREEFLSGASQKGVRPKTAEAIWSAIAGFAGYSFSQAHATAFAIIVYWSAWLRLHYKTEYFCGLLRNSPLGTYPARVLESEARRVGVKFLPFDINACGAKPVVEQGAVRYGLNYVKGIGGSTAEAIVQARGQHPFRSLADFIRRTQLDRRAVEWLVLAGAFDGLGERRNLLWDLAETFSIAIRPPMLPLEIPDEQIELPAMTDEERLLRTYAATGVTTGLSLVDLRRNAFARAGCMPIGKLRNARIGTKVKIGGLVADGIRRPPTANGVAFTRLEQTEGMIEIIIPQDVYVKYQEELRSAFLIVKGKVRTRGAIVSVEADRIQALE